MGIPLIYSVIQLVQTSDVDNVHGSTGEGYNLQDSMSLLDYTNGFTLIERGWIPKVENGGPSVIETLNLIIRATNHDDLIAKDRLIQEWKKKVIWSLDPTYPYQVFLRTKIGNQTYAQQAMVTQIESTPLEAMPEIDFNTPAADGFFYITHYTLTIRRVPFWEPIALMIAAANTLDPTGAAEGISEVIYGDANARLAELAIVYNTAGAEILETMWVGFRSSYWGTLANFVAIWSLKFASYLLSTSSDTVTTVDAGAYSGTRVTCSFASTTALAERVRIQVSDVTSNYNDQRGRFAMLIRAKASDGSTTALLEVREGFYATNADNMRVLMPQITISGTSWEMYELGDVYIPATLLASNQSLRSSCFAISLQRTAGAGSIYLDCIVLVPVSDGFAKLDNLACYDSGTSIHVGLLVVRGDGLSSVFSYKASNFTPENPGMIQQRDLAVPAYKEAPYIVCVSQTTTGHILTNSVTLGIVYAERFRFQRGATA